MTREIGISWQDVGEALRGNIDGVNAPKSRGALVAG